MTTPAAPLPQDLAALDDIRTSLAGYLAALDDNAARKRTWLQEHEALIFIAHHWLDRIIMSGLEHDAIYMAASLGEVQGIVLATAGLGERAREKFGDNSPLGKRHPIFPPRLDLPVIPPELPDGLIPAPVVTPDPVAPAPGKPWWKPDWLQKTSQEKETPHAARQRKRQEWQQTQNDITALQSERHYYVDSLMGWMGDALVSENADHAQMQSYQNPKRIAELAAIDHTHDLQKDLRDLQKRVKLYADFTSLLDDQRIGEFTRILPELFAKPDTAFMRQIREVFLQDYQAVSFAEIALTKVKNRDDQLLLFRAALELEPELKFTGLKKRGEILDRIREETEKKHKPLDDKALRLARKKLDEMEAAREDGVKRRRPQPVTLADLFNAAIDALEESLTRRKAAPPAPRR